MFKISQQKKYIADSRGYDVQKMTESYLRAETLLTAAQGSIEFNLLKSQRQGSTVICTENLLTQNEKFVITALALAFKKLVATPTDALHAIAKLYTWPNDNAGLFDGAAGDVNLRALINSKFSLQINTTQFIKALDTRCMTRVPDTQQGQGFATGGTLTKADGYTNGMFGYYDCDVIEIQGNENVKATVSLPTGLDLTEASEYNYAVLLVKGFLIQP